MARIVIADRIPADAVELLRAQHDVDAWDSDTPMERDELLRRVAGAHAVVTPLNAQVDAGFLDAAGPQLQVVANVAVGFDNIDVAACEQRGVVATNTPGVLTDATADIAFALMLMATRRLGESERLVRSGRAWAWGMNFQVGRSIEGKTIGIVGAGEIGMAMARRAHAFGMSVVYTKHHPLPPPGAGELGARRVELDELLAISDVVSLHAPLIPAGRPGSTHHLIDADALAAMKPTAYLINTARGPVIDEAALVDALREGRIAGAGLDVYEHEPRLHPGLTELENVVLLPHLGSATIETRTAMAELAGRNVLAILGDDPALTPVTRGRTARR